MVKTAVWPCKSYLYIWAPLFVLCFCFDVAVTLGFHFCWNSKLVWLKIMAHTDMSTLDEEELFTKDGTVDRKGCPSLRSKGGRWTACSFIAVYEIFERMANHGISENLVVYLTNKLHESTVTSSNSVTNWSGTAWLTPLLGAYIADAYLGRYLTFVLAASIYLMGMCLLTLSVSLPALRPPPCNASPEICDDIAMPLQVGIFYCSLYIIALGAGGTKPNISTMGADQFDYFDPKERTQKLSFFNWWMFSTFFGNLIASTLIVYIQDNVSWSVGYGIPTAGLAAAILVFLAGTRFYRHKVPSGSPLTRIARVLTAAIMKWRVPLPEDPKELYELDSEHHTKEGKHRLVHSTTLRFLDKAAVRNQSRSPWALCPVTQVEETKQMVKMLPVLFVTFIPRVVNAQSHTLFVKQAATLDRSIGPHFKVPSASLSACITISMLVGLVVYDRWFVPAIRKRTKNPRGITMLQRLGIGLTLQVFLVITASLTELKRLSVVRDHGMAHQNSVVPLSVFLLLPQFLMLGFADVFTEAGKIEFFYDQAPEGMKSLGTSLYTTGVGVGYFLSSFILSTVSNISKRGGGEGWIQRNLNSSHLDYYFGFLAGLLAFNFTVFLVVSKLYVYNSEPEQIDHLRSNEEAVLMGKS